jgi:hypothetical protein
VVPYAHGHNARCDLPKKNSPAKKVLLRRLPNECLPDLLREGENGMDMTTATKKQPIYWRKNQVALTFFSDLTMDASASTIVDMTDANLLDLNQHAFSSPMTLQRQLSPTLRDQKGADPLAGIYVSTAPARTFGPLNLPTADITVFCTLQMQATMPQPDGESDMQDMTLLAVKQLNDYALTGKAPAGFQAMPTWLFSGVPDETHGCPVTPPFPVEKSGRAGHWQTHLPDLPASLQDATGAGVTVFILDAFPAPETISATATAARNQNTLLHRMTRGMVSEAPFIARPPAISLNATYDIAGPQETAVTGKDIYGRLSGFPMANHGLFIAGLVRDIAPAASIECIRILNDFGTGDFTSLVHALTSIEARQRPGGDLAGKPVVVNLSLVIGPPDCDLARLGLAPSRDPQGEKQSVPLLLRGLLSLLQSMGHKGATFIASVGNDSDPRDFSMNPDELRFTARYPAAFAERNPDFLPLAEMIPVGAVNQRGEPASYSNYPGVSGMATYGGELPRPDPWIPSAGAHVIAGVDTSDAIDALRGVFAGMAYPALSRNDHYPPSMQPPPGADTPALPPYPLYQTRSTSGWAYWSGTSFAAPIISALAARILQNQSGDFHGAPVHDALVAIARQTTWTGLESGEDISGPMIVATQTWRDEISSSR